jgi:radical SAM protein with 4Fe4S-binding SPASM domain
MICPSIPELDLGEWGAALHAKIAGVRYPLLGTIELTERCNYRCVHCYINQPPVDRAVKSREMETDQAKHIIDQLVDAGTLFLTLTGGDPFVRKDFTEIYRHAVQRGMLVDLFTNGYRITPQIADLLAEWRPQAIEVSLYGATKATYEKVTQIPGSFERSRKGIQLLLDRDLPVYFKTTLLTINRHELDQMRNFSAFLDVPYRYDGLIWPRLNGDESAFNFQLSPQELVNLDLAEPERMEERARLASLSNGQRVRAEYVYSCGAALQSFHIDSAGFLMGCMMSRKPSYNLMEMDFSTAWEKLGEIRKMKRQLHTKCEHCILGGLCAQCPGWSKIIHGDDETPVEFLCTLAHLRAAQLTHLVNINEEIKIYEEETV